MAQDRSIRWLNVLTVISAAILIGAEVFGAAFASSWALATLFDLGAHRPAHPRRTVRGLRHRHHGAVHSLCAHDRAVHAQAVDASGGVLEEKLRKFFDRAN